MPEDITKGELVRVKVAGLFKGQECPVTHKEHNTEHYGRTAPTWYLLDTRYPGHSWSRPSWFERHEIEPVMPEVGTLHYGYEEWERGLPPMPGPKEPDGSEDRGVV